MTHCQTSDDGRGVALVVAGIAVAIAIAVGVSGSLASHLAPLTGREFCSLFAFLVSLLVGCVIRPTLRL